MDNVKGYLNLVLHTHLPFIKHPEYDSFLEESWLYEAISETYLPLLRMLGRLEADGIPINITISFSPTLTTMLQDPLLCERYVGHLDKLIELGRKEVDRCAHEPDASQLARMYLDLYEANKRDFEVLYERDILKGFDRFYKSGQIELITTPGTYPFLPFYQQYPSNIAAQIEAAVDSHHQIFGRVPKGLWLPECGYFPGLDKFIKDFKFKYFFVAAHGMLFSPNVPSWGVFSPAKTSNNVAFFARDVASANLVWSAETGYPSDPDYRDFYRDIGHDLDFEYIKPYIHLEKIRVNTGYKYYAITGRTDQKRYYNPEKAKKKIREHAANFLLHQSKRIQRLDPYMNQIPVITCPYSTELFGHWWFEGIEWLESVIRLAHEKFADLATVLPDTYLSSQTSLQTVDPVFSSWGNNGYAEVWLESSNDWVYRHIHMAIERLQELISRFPDASGLKERALNQAAREVMLAQSTDWVVIMRTGAAESYAVNRIREHLSNFYRIYDALGQGNLGTEWLTKVEKKHNIFPRLNYRSFASGLPEDWKHMGHPQSIQ